MAELLDYGVEFSSCKINLEIERIASGDETVVTFNVTLVSRYGTIKEEITCLKNDLLFMLETIQDVIDTEKPNFISTDEPGLFMEVKHAQKLENETLFSVLFVIDAGISGPKQVSTDTGPALYITVKKEQLQTFKENLILELDKV
ncbi:hypothetical protein [Oceanobacillus senegalensis]|uniref:hypothetical protein n=1 Tax=Oceanobacillus senegalensis TaxID=1936063 RepID=UPI000A3059CA|nr:hypothetical protein [Oceanobacillus senegalensis]